MFSSSFQTYFLSLAVIVFLSSCSQEQSWVGSSPWFGNNSLAQNSGSSQTPGYGKDPLTPPLPAPVPPVQRLPNGITFNGSVKTKVAILVPLTGPNATLGQAMLNAAQQAVFDVASENFELMPRDTGSDESSAGTAARDAVASGAQLLIGPVFAAAVPSVVSVARNNNINVLTLSSDASLAEPGVFVMGFTAAPQVERVVSYASMHGLHHFAALIPNNAYGALVGRAFQESVARHGGTLVDYQTYDPARHDSNMALQILAQHRDQIDALFLPEGGSDIDQISSQSLTAGFNSHLTRLLGTGLWDVPGIASQNNFLVGGWYAASDPKARTKFISSYMSAYGQEPPRLVTLAYDATALAAALAKHGSIFSAQDLTNPNGFAGLDGIFRLTQQGLTERGLAINEITESGPRVIDPSPTSFTTAP